MACSSVTIECFLCTGATLSTPESLCAHMRNLHSMGNAVVEHVLFNDRFRFQRWLESVEDSRAERSGYVPRESSSDVSGHDDEYYLLCRRRSPILKRRRLAGGQMREATNGTCSLAQPIACTAFVHVTESPTGWVSVRYCLEHCGHSSRSSWRSKAMHGRETSCFSGRSLSHLKRSSSNLTNDSEDEDYASEECVSEESIEEDLNDPNCDATIMESLMEGPSADGPACSMEPTALKKSVVERKSILGSIENELASAKASVSSIKDSLCENIGSNMNAIISERLQSTADRLRMLTKVLADLAIDINSAEDVCM